MIDAYDFCGDDGMLDLYDRKMVKARKSHDCCECHGPISKGDDYERASGLNRSESCYENFKTCAPCIELRDATFENGTTHGALWDVVEEEVNERRAASGAEHTWQEDFFRYQTMVNDFKRRRQKARDDYHESLHK